MMVSINCLLLRKTSFHDTFAVNVANDNDIRDSLVKFDNLKISDLKYFIYNEINHDIEFNYDDIDLWKINIAYNDNKLKHVTTEDEFGGKKLVIILHIDEYQEIFTFENNKGLFKEMMLTLGPLITESNKDKEGYWMCNTSVLQLLYNTSGLPRALETIINECFKKETFFLDVKNNNFTLFDDVFQVVINSLANQYKLDKFIKNNRNISYKLLYYSIRAIPVDLDTVISKKLKVLTVKDLMRDGWLNIVPDTTHKMLQPDSKMVWDTLEKFVANYKIFRNNLLAKLKKYKKGISLKEFYHGAVSKDLVLEIKMGLKKLDLREAKNQFP
ncbi:hypothetical protein RhiirB3_424646 [Rhizophagus irregularis]|nr:hypothetical protein RhiirB3_424646 [Rhizophagus irregularis]